MNKPKEIQVFKRTAWEITYVPCSTFFGLFRWDEILSRNEMATQIHIQSDDEHRIFLNGIEYKRSNTK